MSEDQKQKVKQALRNLGKYLSQEMRKEKIKAVN